MKKGFFLEVEKGKLEASQPQEQGTDPQKMELVQNNYWRKGKCMNAV